MNAIKYDSGNYTVGTFSYFISYILLGNANRSLGSDRVEKDELMTVNDELATSSGRQYHVKNETA